MTLCTLQQVKGKHSEVIIFSQLCYLSLYLANTCFVQLRLAITVVKQTPVLLVLVSLVDVMLFFFPALIILF